MKTDLLTVEELLNRLGIDFEVRDFDMCDSLILRTEDDENAVVMGDGKQIIELDFNKDGSFINLAVWDQE